MSLPHGRARLVGRLICVLIALSLLNGVSGGSFPAWPAGLVAWTCGALLLPSIERFQRLQVALMGGAGLLSLTAAVLAGDRAWAGQLAAGNQALLAMLATVSFLRMVTRTGARPGERLPRGPIAIVQTLLATHVFSVIINISAMFIIGQRISADGSLTPLQARVLSRAFVAAACWSPLFASMAVVLHYVPGVDMFSVSRVNVMLALVLLAYCALTLVRDADAAGFVGYPVHREALVVPVTLSVIVIACYNVAPEWPILTVIGVSAMACVSLFAGARPAPERRRLLTHHIEQELPRMSGEFALFLGAAVLATGVGALARASALDLVIDPHSAGEAVTLLVSLVALTLLGIHPVISVATLSGLFPAELARPDLVGVVVLMAWTTALGVSPFSGTTLAMQGRFGIPATRFARWNLDFLLVGLAAGSLLLGVVDYLALA